MKCEYFVLLDLEIFLLRTPLLKHNLLFQFNTFNLHSKMTRRFTKSTVVQILLTYSSVSNAAFKNVTMLHDCSLLLLEPRCFLSRILNRVLQLVMQYVYITV